MVMNLSAADVRVLQQALRVASLAYRDTTMSGTLCTGSKQLICAAADACDRLNACFHDQLEAATDMTRPYRFGTKDALQDAKPERRRA